MKGNAWVLLYTLSLHPLPATLNPIRVGCGGGSKKAQLPVFPL